MRAQILTLREQEYVTSARAIGATELRVAMTHLFPNAIPPMIIALTLGIPAAIFAEAGLSFIGVGVNEPVPSLGKMVSDSRQYIQLYWHLALFPSLAIALAVLGFAFLGDGLRDALDPRQI
jgi:ABC-type dipeptide/oligopeptide/nickel transport system permease subunit